VPHTVGAQHAAPERRDDHQIKIIPTSRLIALVQQGVACYAPTI